MRARFHAPGVTVVALVPSAGPGAAADDGGDARGQRLVDDLRADEVHVAVDRAGGEDPAVAGEDLGRRADHQRGVDAVHRVGVAGLADADDPAVADADVGLDDAPVIEDRRAPVMTRSGVPSARVAPDWPIDSRITLPPPNTASSPPTQQVALDLDQQVGVGQPDAVAGGRAVEPA